MRRRLLLLAVVAIALAVVVVGTLPWWLGVALRTAGPRWGLTVGAYERIGFSRFAVRDVDYRRGNVHVTAKRVEAVSPARWLGRGGAAGTGEVVVGRWSVDVGPRQATIPAVKPSGGAASAGGWMPLRAILRRVAARLDRWVPRAKLADGTVRWPGGGLSIGAATWGKRTLEVRALTVGSAVMAASLGLPADADELRLVVMVPESDGRAVLTDRSGEVAGELSWAGQRAPVTARFGAAGWMPAVASVHAEAWTVPATRLRLGELYSVVRGRGRVDWSEHEFRADLAVTGEPLGDKKAPPLEATLRGRGDVRAFTVEALHATLPGIVAELSEPVTIERSGNFRESAARFAVQVDLAKQPWFAARGKASVEARLVSGVTQAPVVEFRAEARDFAAEDLQIAVAEVSGSLAWPRLQVAAATLVGPGGERLQGSGGWDFRAREIRDAVVEGEIRRTTLARWLPVQPQFETVALKLRASGPLAKLRHDGEATAAGVTFDRVKPLAVVAMWRGAGSAIEAFTIGATAATTKLAVTGTVDRDGLRLSALDFIQDETVRLRLAQPAVIHWRPSLSIEGVKLAGPAATIDADVTWGPAGRVAIAASGVSSDWGRDVMALPGPTWKLNTGKITGAWDRGPMTFAVTVDATVAMGRERTAVVTLAARGDGEGIKIEALRAAEGTELILNATGALPAVVTPFRVNETAADRWWKIDPSGALTLDVSTAPSASFWRELTVWSGVEFKEPSVAAHVTGTWARPVGDVRIQVARIAAEAKRFKRPLPALEALEVTLTGDRDGVRLERFAARVEGQAVSARGRLPVAAEAWAKVFKEPRVLLRRDAELRVEMPDVDLAALAGYLPGFLAPKGKLVVDAGYKDGALDGSVRLSGAATRLLGPLGVVQDIEADVRLAGRTVEVRSLTGTSGGEVVRLAGRVELPEAAAGATVAGSPKYDLILTGKNLPFVRRTGLLVRGDLDLKLTTPERGEPRLSGTVRLRDSLFLQDIRALLPGGARGAARRPPYFAVETPPFDAWPIDVTLTGDRFMRLRTAVFNGVASARFRLGGTLGEPVAIGEATIDEGRVRLPFATFEVQEGRVTLTREQPFEPQLWLAGTSRRYDYDLRMELSGAASAPVLVFSSSPPLEHGQVLLMVMAGEAPMDEVTYSGNARAVRLGAYVGQSLLANLGRSDDADRLSITTGERVSRQGRETYQMEYRLSDKWSVTGEIDEFDDYNAGLKWRVYTKGGAKKGGADDDKSQP